MSTNRMLLTEYLAEQISKREMYRVIFQITEALLATEGNTKQVNLDINTMEMEDGRVIVDYQTDAVPNTIDRITDFFKELVFHCVFRFGEVLDDLSDFLEFLDDRKEVTLEYIYEYVADELDIDVNLKKDLNMNANNNAHSNSAVNAGQIQSAEMSRMESQSPDYRQTQYQDYGQQQDFRQPSNQPYRQNSYQEYDNPRYGQPSGNLNQGETGVLDVNFWQQNKLLQDADKIQRNSQKLNNAQVVRPVEHTVSENDETGVLDASFWENERKIMASGKFSQNLKPSVMLVNEKSGEETRIKKDLFIIGKDSSVADLVISNKTISRNHAEISIKGLHYFVKDNGSTNKTYVDGKEIPPNTNVEIYVGTVLKFSNEVYRFIVR